MSQPMHSLEPPPGADQRAAPPRLVRILLGLLLLWAVALRIWFATPDLGPNRFWDERHGLENIAPLLNGAGLRPANGYHPSLSYLPEAAVLAASELVHRTTGSEVFAVFGHRGSLFSPTAYLLCRLVQVVFGALSLIVLYLIGRRLEGPWLGLLAAFLLSVVPWHIRQSVIYKPDILLVLTVLMAFYLTLRAVERPSLGRYAAGGVGIGVALASKFNAGPIAVPLVIGTLFRARQGKRIFLWLLAAGLISIGVFVVLNPYTLIEPELYRESFGKTLSDYARKGETRGGDSRLYLLWHAVGSLLSQDFHGPWIGALAMLGLVLVSTLAARRSLGDSRQAVSWLLVPGYIASYVALYAASTTNPSAHNWLPLSPFLALSAAWLLRRIYKVLETRFSALGQPVAVAVAAFLLVLATAWPAQLYVYRGVVPETSQLAGNSLRPPFRRVSGRLIYSEVELGVRARPRGSHQELVDRLDTLTSLALNRGDAEIFRQRRLQEGPAADFYRARMERVPAGNLRIAEPGLFRARGPALVVISHPRRRRTVLVGEWLRSTTDRLLYEPRLPEGLKSRNLVSLDFRLPAQQIAGSTVELLIDGQSHPVWRVERRRRWVRYISPRFLARSEFRLRLTRPLADDRLPLIVQRWGKHRLPKTKPG